MFPCILILVLVVSTSSLKIADFLPASSRLGISAIHPIKPQTLGNNARQPFGLLPSHNGVSPRWFTVTSKVAVFTVLYYIVGMPRKLPDLPRPHHGAACYTKFKNVMIRQRDGRDRYGRDITVPDLTRFISIPQPPSAEGGP